VSEMTRAEEEQAADATLDGQIAEHEQEKYEQRMRDEAAMPDDTEPDQEPPAWFHDPDETVAFARWYWDGAHSIRGTAGEILDYFEKPWLFNEEYAGYKHETH